VQVERLKRLLAYWVCMGALQISEAILMPLVGGSGVVPKHYNVARLIAIYWMQGGDFSHSTDIYCRSVVPLFAFAPRIFLGSLLRVCRVVLSPRNLNPPKCSKVTYSSDATPLPGK
jgi:hypothetical protein